MMKSDQCHQKSPKVTKSDQKSVLLNRSGLNSCQEMAPKCEKRGFLEGSPHYEEGVFSKFSHRSRVLAGAPRASVRQTLIYLPAPKRGQGKPTTPLSSPVIRLLQANHGKYLLPRRPPGPFSTKNHILTKIHIPTKARIFYQNQHLLTRIGPLDALGVNIGRATMLSGCRLCVWYGST